MEDSNNTFLRDLKNNWVIISLVVGLIAGWTANGITLASNTNRIEKIEQTQVSRDLAWTQIQTDLAAIKTSIFYIEKSLK